MLSSLIKGAFRSLWCRPVRSGGEAEKNKDGLETLLVQAEELYGAGRLEEARMLYQRVLARDADNRDALFHTGVLAARSQDYLTAQALLERLTDRYPDFLGGLNARANLEKLQGRWVDARHWYGRALAVKPDSAAVLANLGTCLKDAGHLEEAARTLEQALALEAGNLDARLNYATVLVDMGRSVEAERELRRILELDPNVAEAHTSLGHLLLARGDFDDGWREYEWRYRCQDAKKQLAYPYPAWDGSPLDEDILLVRGEQGLGDQIMFASCIPDLLSRVPRCMLECDPRLVPLFARSFPSISVCCKHKNNPQRWAQERRVPQRDVFLSSLPGFFRRQGSNFPSYKGYLRAEPSRVSAWRVQLADLGPGLTIGISWRGGAAQTRQSLRSIPLTEWLPVLRTRGARFVSLQYGPHTDEIAALRGTTTCELHHWPEAIDDYDETAALVTALDLVISVQTAVVHLAGALGKPVWVMVPAAPEWRYMRSGETMPWYPTARLFRQETLLEWQPVVERVGCALQKLMTAIQQQG